jgi:hypothetical protein
MLNVGVTTKIKFIGQIQEIIFALTKWKPLDQYMVSTDQYMNLLETQFLGN